MSSLEIWWPFWSEYDVKSGWRWAASRTEARSGQRRQGRQLTGSAGREKDNAGTHTLR